MNVNTTNNDSPVSLSPKEMMAALMLEGIGTGLVAGVHLVDGTPVFSLQLGGTPYALWGSPLQGHAHGAQVFLATAEHLGRLVGDLDAVAEHFGFSEVLEQAAHETLVEAREWYRKHCTTGPHTIEEVEAYNGHPHDRERPAHLCNTVSPAPGIDGDPDEPGTLGPEDPAGPTEGEGSAGSIEDGDAAQLVQVTTPGTATRPAPILYPANGRELDELP